MQLGVLRFPGFLLRPVLSGLMLAALVPVGPVIAGEAGAGVPPVLWQHLPADDGGAGLRQYPAEFRGLTGFELVVREADDGVSWRGVFFRAGGWLRIGAQGSFDPNSGSLRAIVALRLDF